jgi:hypothetical protein
VYLGAPYAFNKIGYYLLKKKKKKIDTACAKLKGRLLIICFFTVRLLVLFGTLFSVILACHGSCLARWRGCLLVGCREAGLGVRLFGKWFLYVSFGVYGWKETRDALRILRDPWRNSRPSFSICFTLGQQPGLLL